MDTPQPFVVPDGVVFADEADGIIIENRGDVVLHTTFGRPLKRVVSTEGSVTIHTDVRASLISAAGNIEVTGSTTADVLRAGGSITLPGTVQATQVEAGSTVAFGSNATIGTVRGNVVAVSGSSFSARGIQGWSQVQIGDCRLQVDAIIAPEVILSPRTSGKSTVIESNNDLGPNAIKGGFRLSDYAEMIGDPSAFLKDRGLVPPSEARAGRPVSPAQDAGGESATTSVTVLPPPAAPAASLAGPAVASPTIAPPPGETPNIEIEEVFPPDATEEHPIPAYDRDEPMVHLDVAEEEEEAEPLRPAHPLHGQLEEAVQKVIESYAGAEVPPAAERLHGLVSGRSYDQIRSEITTIWSDLLRFHQKKGLRVQLQVTTTFNTINGLVKKM